MNKYTYIYKDIYLCRATVYAENEEEAEKLILEGNVWEEEIDHYIDNLEFEIEEKVTNETPTTS